MSDKTRSFFGGLGLFLIIVSTFAAVAASLYLAFELGFIAGIFITAICGWLLGLVFYNMKRTY